MKLEKKCHDNILPVLEPHLTQATQKKEETRLQNSFTSQHSLKMEVSDLVK